jgi:hypothetical protein
MASVTLDDVLHVRGVGEAIVALLPCDALCCVAAVSRHCNELACAPSLYARLFFSRLTLKRNGRSRVVSDAVLATLCRRAGASLRFLNLRAGACARVTPAGLAAALQAPGVDRGMLRVRMPDWTSEYAGVSWHARTQRWHARFFWNPADTLQREEHVHLPCTVATVRRCAFAFNEEEEAARCYDAMVRAHGGAAVNFP